MCKFISEDTYFVDYFNQHGTGLTTGAVIRGIMKIGVALVDKLNKYITTKKIIDAKIISYGKNIIHINMVLALVAHRINADYSDELQKAYDRYKLILGTTIKTYTDILAQINSETFVDDILGSVDQELKDKITALIKDLVVREQTLTTQNTDLNDYNAKLTAVLTHMKSTDNAGAKYDNLVKFINNE